MTCGCEKTGCHQRKKAYKPLITAIFDEKKSQKNPRLIPYSTGMNKAEINTTQHSCLSLGGTLAVYAESVFVLAAQ